MSASRDGAVLLWRVFCSRQQADRPPLSTSPHAAFHVHTGEVTQVSLNTYAGLAASAARRAGAAHADEVAVYSTRRRRYIRSLVLDAGCTVLRLAITALGNIALCGLDGAGTHALWLYSLTGRCVCVCVCVCMCVCVCVCVCA
jgi:hypothetical protein